MITQIHNESDILLDQLCIEKGRLFTAHVFIDPDGKDYLFLACHHLAIDVISWNIIIDELLDHYDIVARSGSPAVISEDIVNTFSKDLSRKEITLTSFNGDLIHEKIHKFPVSEAVAGLTGMVEVYNIVLPIDISRFLRSLDEQNRSKTLSGFLISAFGKAILEEFSLSEISIDVEFHGRPQHEGLTDLSRSVAWWAVTVPVNLEQSKLTPGYCTDLINRKTELANKINLYPGEFSDLPADRSDIRFNYLGHFPDKFENSSICLKPSVFNPGSTRSEEAQREYKIFITSRFIGDLLVIDIQYQTINFTKRNIDSMATLFFTSLKQYIKEESGTLASCDMVTFRSNIPSVGLPLYNVTVGKKGQGKKAIFLTGVTGFLGINLLDELLRYDQALIYCLVRGDSKTNAESRLKACLKYYFNDTSLMDSNRIRVIKGDLLSDNFGIQASEYEEIINEVNIILHAAADINLLKDYSELKAVNVTSTKGIIKLAQTGRPKTLHYISTLAVSGFPPDGNRMDFSEDDFEYGQLFISDYERTKFESEKLIREFLKNGGEGKIYRVGHIAAESIRGKFQCNIDENRIFQILKGLMLLKKIPDLYVENVSFSHVDIVAKAISLICMERVDSQMQCFHIENPYYLSFIEIADLLKQMGYDIETVGLEMFKRAVINFEGTKSDKRIVNLTDNWVQRYIDFPRRINFIQKKSLDLFAGYGLYFRKMSLAWLSSMISEGIKAGYFQPPLVPDSSTLVLADAEYYNDAVS